MVNVDFLPQIIVANHKSVPGRLSRCFTQPSVEMLLNSRSYNDATISTLPRVVSNILLEKCAQQRDVIYI